MPDKQEACRAIARQAFLNRDVLLSFWPRG